ncbi:hypothetical protein J4460_06140 [Candidatus Woesearchaeota archaeon]|nr:hypothetical protein [Candidatus Woesearchaeota archaeon]HIH37578.1 hypothetical protein [Candidatus Woesearchaeota archaeon]HIH47991.1 hypothetical protein [Candidatus Woesearchaeota archaeon]HIJ03681.1 hypothetical protein [Candidatus Woesearchaeota archaeon]
MVSSSIQYPFLVGVLQIADMFLAIVAGLISLNMVRHARRQEHLRPWKMLIPMMVLFALEMVIKALRAFGIFESPYLTHVIPSIMMGFLIAALVMQIQITEAI